jgi:regulator of sigma E protease
MEILMITAQLILSLSILVILHELGHFIPARLFKIRVEKFYLFFDPWFSIFKIKKGETEYGIGWLPLGGYVKIAGMIDESMDKEQMKQPAQPWEFRAKPAWQRLIVMIGGVTVNLILGMFIYAMVLYVWGKEFLPMKNVTTGIMVSDSLIYNAGFRNGDQLLEVNGIVPEDFRDANLALLLETSSFAKVKRNNEIINIPIAPNLAEEIIELKQPVAFYEAFPAVIAEMPDTSGAKKAGLKKDDQIIAINQQPVNWFAELSETLKPLSGKSADVTVLRGTDSVTVVCQISNEGKIGFTPYGPDKFFKTEIKRYSFFGSFPAGIEAGAETLGNYVKQFKLVFTKAGAKQVGGFASMAKQFDSEWDWKKFWGFTAFLSIALAFMNILPIPALDGGHVVFLIYEMITGKQPNEKFLERAQLVGMVLLLSLLLFANGNDLYKWIVKLMG